MSSSPALPVALKGARLLPRLLPADSVWAGALLVMGSEFLFASMAAAIRSLSGELSSEVIVFFRNALGLLFLLPWLLRNPVGLLGTGFPLFHLLRSCAGLAAMYCFFYAIAHMPLAEAMLLKLSAPLFVPFIALFWLGERVPWPVRWAILIGFGGVGIILSPELRIPDGVAFIALLGGLFAATAKTTLRRLSHSEPALRTVFYFALLGTVVSAVPLFWSERLPGLSDIPGLLLVAATATLGQWFLTLGYSCAPAARVAPFSYSSVLFAAGYGWYFWDEPFTWRTALGALLVAISGILASRGGGGGRRV